MKQLSLAFIMLVSFTACTEEQRPAAQAKHALDSAQHAADQAAQHAQDMADKAQEMIDSQ